MGLRPALNEGPYRAAGRHQRTLVQPRAGACKAVSVTSRYSLRLLQTSNLRVGGSNPSRRAIFFNRLEISYGAGVGCTATMYSHGVRVSAALHGQVLAS